MTEPPPIAPARAAMPRPRWRQLRTGPVLTGLALVVIAVAAIGSYVLYQKRVADHARRLDAGIATLVELYRPHPINETLPGAVPPLRSVFARIVRAAASDPLMGKAEAALARRDTADATLHLRAHAAALDARPATPRAAVAAAHRMLGYVALLIDPTHARPAFVHAATLDPTDMEGRFWLGWTSLVNGRMSDALGAYTAIVDAPGATGPLIVWARIGLGDIERLSGRLEPAATAYSLALRDIRSLSAAGEPSLLTKRLVLVTNGRQGNVALARGDVAIALDILTASRDIAASLVTEAPSDLAVLREVAVANTDLASALVIGGRLTDAVAARRDALDAFKRRAAAAPGDAARQRDVAVAVVGLGDTQRTQGQLDAALASYRAAHEIIVELASAPGVAEARSHRQQDLAVSYQRMGDIEMQRANPVAALDHYQASRNVADALVRSAPSTAAYQRLQVLAASKIGAAQIALRDLAGALDTYTKAESLARRLAERDAGNAVWQRDLLMAESKVGDALEMLGRPQEALKAYHGAYRVATRLAAADPANTELQRDRSVLATKGGGIVLALGNARAAIGLFAESLKIREQLAASQPANAVWQRDLAIAFGRMADALTAAGQSAEAMALIARSGSIVDRLARADPTNAMLLLDLARTHERQATAARLGGDAPAAIAAYQRSAAIYAGLLAANPGNISMQVNATVPMIWIGELDADRRTAQFGQALAILKELDAKGQLEARRRGNIAYLERRLGLR